MTGWGEIGFVLQNGFWVLAVGCWVRGIGFVFFPMCIPDGSGLRSAGVGIEIGFVFSDGLMCLGWSTHRTSVRGLSERLRVWGIGFVFSFWLAALWFLCRGRVYAVPPLMHEDACFVRKMFGLGLFRRMQVLLGAGIKEKWNFRRRQGIAGGICAIVSEREKRGQGVRNQESGVRSVESCVVGCQFDLAGCCRVG
jgi:hypothetical protein